jgi:hypothetical protein
VSSEAPPEERVTPKPFQKGYKPSAEQLAAMQAGRERAKAERAEAKTGPARPFEGMFKGGAPMSDKARPPKKGAATIIDKQTLVEALQMVNVALDITGAGYRIPPDARQPNGQIHPRAGQSVYSLEREEIVALADAWFEIAKRYPVFGNFLVAGRTMSVWGNALFVTYVVVGKRVAIADELSKQRRRAAAPGAPTGPAAAGPAHPGGGNDGLGENGPSPEAPIVH